MKNNYNAVSNPTTSFRNISLFFLILLGTVLSGKVNAQTNYKAEGESHVMITTATSNDVPSATVNCVNAEGDFIIKDGVLDNISSLKLTVPIQKENEGLKNKNIDFNLSHVMILPIMKKIHVVGLLNVAGISQRAFIDFNYVINSDQSITLTGNKVINLKEFEKDAEVQLASLNEKNENQLDLKMNFIFKNDTYKLSASNNVRD